MSFLKDTHSVPTRLVAHLLIFTLAYTPIFGAMNGTAAFAQAVQTTTNKFEYDAQGNLKRITDPLSRVTDLTYDPLRRLTLAQLPPPVVGAVRPTIQYGYDGLDFLSTVKDPRQLTTSYTVNGFGNTEAVISPDTGTTTQAFNAGTNTVATAKDADARLFTLSNDLGGRVKSITFLSGVPTTFEYDGGATPVVMAKGALTKMTDESGTTLYTYSAFGELASKSQTVTAAGVSKTHVVSYVYGSAGSANGKVSSMTYPSGSRVNYGYDTAGRVASLTVNPANGNGVGPNTAVQYKLLNNVNYAAHGPVKGWSWGNSSTAAPNSYVRVFDLDGRIASYNLGNPLTTGTTRTLTYDAASRIKAYTHTSSGAGINAGALNQTFGYDDADQLASYSGNGTSQGFKYDPSGNRTQLTIGSATYTNSIAATSNRVASTTGPAPAKTNSYDLSGNLKSDATVTYTYSAQSRMSAAKNGATVSSYLYNGIGQRVRQIASTQTANPFGILVYDESGQIIGEYDTSTGKATREYIYLGATLVGVLEDVLTGTAPNQVHVTNLIYAYTDHLNTPRILARSSDNKIVWRWDNGDPFGVIPPNENPSAAGQFKLNLRMPGQYFDSTTNLFYNYFRDYDPQLGRYIQSDPIGLAGGINTYAYVGSRPLNFVDPRGQFCVPCGILIVGLAITWYQVASKAHRNQSTLDDNGEYCPPSANGWKWPIFAESEEGTNSEGDGEEAKSGDNVEDVTKRPSRVRKGTEQSNWDNAEDGPNGGKNCPTCDKEVQSQPGTKYKDWDNDHTEPWRERDLTGKDRKGVLDEYNRDTRLRCVNCNRGDTR